MSEKKEDENLGSFYMGRMRPPPEPERVLPKGFLSAIAVLAFIGIIWYAYPQGQEKFTDVDVPVITADTSSYKSKPAEPGGMDVPHQDSTVFETVDKKGVTQKTEKILPKQEEPLDKKKLGLDAKKPQLNLEPEGKTLAKPEVVKLAEAPKAEAKTEPKAEAKPAEEKQAEKSAAAAAPATPKDSYIQLGAYKSEAEAKSEGVRLQGKFEILKGLPLRTQKVEVKGATLYRLQAGSTTFVYAKDVCAALKTGKAICIVVKG